MKKPVKIKKEYLDYHECQNFLEKKYNYDETDYSKHFGQRERFIKDTGNVRPPYYAVKSDKGGHYAYPINNIDIWKFFVGPSEKQYKEVTKEEWDKAKSNYDNWEAKFKEWEKENPEPEYQNFWHWIIDRYEIHNGCEITFYESEPPAKDWQKEIYMRYIEEFGEGEIGNREINFYVSW